MKNLKKAYREIKNEKITSLINILGLSIGMTCFILIFIWVSDEISYDKSFENVENIYRVNFEFKLRSEEQYMASCPGALSEVIKEEIPEVIAATRIYQFGDYSLKYNENNLQLRGAFINPDFFNVFSYNVKEGNTDHLSARNKIILTESAAERLLGDQAAIGKFVRIPDQNPEPFEVVAMIEDNPKKSHIHFDLLFSQITHDWMYVNNGWFGNLPYTYVKLSENTEPEVIESKFPGIIKKYVEPLLINFSELDLEQYYAAGNKYNFHLQPLTDIHLKSELENEIEAGGNILYVKLFTIIAIFILLIACFNFINISTANSVKQAREVGVRKVLGAFRNEIARQFLLKSFLLSLLSVFIAVFISALLIPVFNELTGKTFSFTIFTDPALLLVLVIIVFFVGLASGSYPAFLLSSFNPVNVLRGKLLKASKKNTLRDILVVLQFTIAIIVILSTIVVYKQLRYFQKVNLGFDKEYVVVVHRGRAVDSNQRESFKQSLLSYSDFTYVTFCQDPPGNSYFEGYFQLEGADQTNLHQVSFLRVDHDYAATLNLKMNKGRFFSPEFASDSTAVVINEAAVKEFGITNPLEQRFDLGQQGNGERLYWHIVGVVENYNFQSLKENIKPVLIRPTVPDWAYFLMVKVKPGNIQSSLSKLQDTWDKYTGGEPFNYTFLDDDLYNLYESEILTKKIFGIFAILSVFIACLGLYSLAAHYAQQRTKEIGIRKANGARSVEILALLSRDFTKWVLIACAIGLPVAGFGMHRWLQGFANRIQLSWWIFFLSAFLSILIALFTVSWQSWRVARRNPVESLRYE